MVDGCAAHRLHPLYLRPAIPQAQELGPLNILEGNVHPQQQVGPRNNDKCAGSIQGEGSQLHQ